MGYDMNDTSAVLTSCPKSIDSYVRNLTSSYADKSNESSVVATSVFMLVLTAGFFNLNLFSRVSNTSAVLNPTARRLLSSALDIFPAVMSYLLSEAKNAGPGGDSSSSSDLPVRARLILTWMLLVELLRKKVAAILVTPGAGPDQGYGAIISHAATVVWHGYLVFYNIKGAGRVAVFGILWLLGAAKFLQRVAFTEIGKRSLAYGKNARLLSSYMAQMLQARGPVSEPDTPWKRLEMCKYVVMGEENLVVMPGPHGYQLDLARVDDDNSRIVTVGKIWEVAADAEQSSGHRRLFQSNPRIRRLCLSYALFKLLRRRFEHLPAMTKEETDDCRDLVFKGLCSIRDSGDDDDNAAALGGGGVALFQVLKDEISFLSEYHHSVHPVVLASPYFFLVNYFLFPTVVCGLCLMTILLCGNGDMAVAFGSIMADNYAMSAGVFTMTRCLWQNFLKTPAAFFSTIDISITYLLFLAFIYEEIWEFLVFVFSKWFMVSLLCTYTAKPRSWGLSKTYSGVLHRISYANRKLSHPSRIACKQLSVLSRLSWLSMALGTASLPKQAKSSMTERFRSAAYGGAPLSNGKDILLLLGRRHQRRHDYSHLSWFCESESVAEVILTWHIATSLLEVAVPLNQKAAGGRTASSSSSSSRPAADSHRTVATRLSRYCAYLVAFHPELLPDDPEGTERVYKDMKKGLKEALHCWDYHLASESARYRKLMDDEFLPDPDCRDVTMNVVKKGAMLGKALVDEAAKEDERSIWKLLDDLWVELIVYVAPSSSDEHMKGHEEALLQGGELVTLLWALATHTGITRPPPTETKVVVTRVKEDLEEGSQVAVTRVEEDLEEGLQPSPP